MKFPQRAIELDDLSDMRSRQPYLVQILLPLCNNEGRAFPASVFAAVKFTLLNHFQCLTTCSRTATEGLWRMEEKLKRDDIVVYEVMVNSFDAKWWRNYRGGLEKMFYQESVVIRAEGIIPP
jgi:hypothetical protein